MTQVRTASKAKRSSQTRQSGERKHETREPVVYVPPALLDAPPPREGMRQRWVSVSILGNDLSAHAMKRQREGWHPRPADTLPKNWPAPTMDHGPFKGCIGIEGLILCEMSEEMAQARDRYFRRAVQTTQAFLAGDLGPVEREVGVPITTTVKDGHDIGSRDFEPEQDDDDS